MSTLAITALVLGLLGGAHCMGMCGGLIGAVTLSRPDGGLLTQLGYNTGRVASYCCAGTIAGVAGSLGQMTDSLLPVQMILLVVANAVVILLGLSLAGRGSMAGALESLGARIWRGIGRLRVAALPSSRSRFGFMEAVGLGAVWGWVPCGLVYSALAMALVSGNAATGAGVMLAFGLGTLPTLVAAGMAAKRLRRFLAARSFRRIAGGLVAVLGLVGLWRIPGLAERINEGLACVV